MDALVAESTLYASLAIDGKEAVGLLKWLSPTASGELLRRATDLMNLPQEQFVGAIQKETRRLKSQTSVRSLDEVDPSWLLDELVRERPTVIAYVLEHLQPKTAGWVLNHLPATLRRRAAAVMERNPIASNIAQMIKNRFLQRFSERSGERGTSLSRSILRLSKEDLQTLIRELGLREMALALRGSRKNLIESVVQRMPTRYVDKIQRRLKMVAAYPYFRVREAQLIILDIAQRAKNPIELFMFAGVGRLASVLAGEGECVRTVMQRLPKFLGEQLHWHVSDPKLSSVEGLRETLTTEIEQILYQLASLGRIGTSQQRLREPSSGLVAVHG